jgi:hypothetical protein
MAVASSTCCPNLATFARSAPHTMGAEAYGVAEGPWAGGNGTRGVNVIDHGSFISTLHYMQIRGGVGVHIYMDESGSMQLTN